MKYVRGFLMAWGCFCWIPCPYKKWNDEDRTAMVATLPLVGSWLGLLTAIVWMLLGALGAGPVLCGAVVTAAYFVMTGFIHLDGFMDVCDAVMPRHPEQAVRIRILKDPHTGSFAAISMVLMLLVFAASVAALSGSWGIVSTGGLAGSAASGLAAEETGGLAAGAASGLAAGSSGLWGASCLALIAVTTTSRCVSAMTVICCAPMKTSQYAAGSFSEDKSFGKALPALIITVLVIAGCIAVCLHGPHMPGFVPGTAQLIATELRQLAAWSVAAAAAVCAVTALIIGALDRRSLGGMNGDISGHMITSGEMAGMLAAAILMS